MPVDVSESKFVTGMRRVRIQVKDWRNDGVDISQKSKDEGGKYESDTNNQPPALKESLFQRKRSLQEADLSVGGRYTDIDFMGEVSRISCLNILLAVNMNLDTIIKN